MSKSESARPVADVLLPLAIAGTYTYAVPAGMAVEPGDYVRVPLGPRRQIGVVWATGRRRCSDLRLREIDERLDAEAMGALQRRFVDWVAGYYVQPPGMVLRMCVRVGEALGPLHGRTAWRASGTAPKRMTAARRRVLDVAETGVAMTAGELAENAGVSRSVVTGLARAGALEEVALAPFAPFARPDPGRRGPRLSADQRKAAGCLRQVVTHRDFSVTLLDGVTGAGKTEVYFEAMAAALAAGRQVLVMLPEIALTASFIARVEDRFGAAPGEWHSGLRRRERERVWRAVASGEATIVVGARSSLFLPWRRLGLIIVDEEHEGAYKQDDGVPYHGRDMAVVYGSLGRFPVILASATPSLESLVNVERGRYRHVSLERRHGGAILPKIEIVDLRRSPPQRGRWLSPVLVAALEDTLERGEQALLFLNRRGYAPLTLCRACGHRIQCPQCSAWLVEHRFRRQLMCHHCGHCQPTPATCPSCGERDVLVACGPGIERLAEEAGERFPHARIAVLSSDLQRGGVLRDTLAAVAAGEYDIIVGTQLVAKGHHFPNLTLAGVVDADLALETIDPRAGERTWQLLAQVAGRAGRENKPGRAVIQTWCADNALMTALAAGDRDAFLGHEKAMREAAGLPPFGQLAAVILSGRDGARVEGFAGELARRAPRAKGVEVLGPAPAPMALVRGRVRIRFLVRAARKVDIQAFVRAWLAGVKTPASVRLAIDADPYNFY